MSDVLFVCVGADAAQADALADVFQQAAFSVSDEKVSADSIARARVCVIVWSSSSMESLRFNTAMAEAIGANKAVIACVDTPDDIALAAPAFDISAWTGEADDTALDNLFDAVDRMAPQVVTPDEVAAEAEPALVRLIAETSTPQTADAKRARTRQRTPHADFDPLRLSPQRRHLRLVHGVLAVLLIGGFAFTNLAPARSAEPAYPVAQMSDETVSLIPGAQNFTMDELMSDRPLPPMPALPEGIGPVSLASLASFEVTPAQPIRPRRARVYLAAAEAPPVSAASESDNIETAVAYLASAPSVEAALTGVVLASGSEADKPDVKPNV